jgi:hypothetical protein
VRIGGVQSISAQLSRGGHGLEPAHTKNPEVPHDSCTWKKRGAFAWNLSSLYQDEVVEMDSVQEDSTLHLPWRIDARDVKLNLKEEVLSREHPQGLRVCMCNICLGENRSLWKAGVVATHLQLYGRAPWLRGSTPVRLLFPTLI